MKVELKNYKELDDARAEAYKILNTNITFSGDDIHVIAVTSSQPDEGKSDVAFHIADTFAKNGNKTLVIDADNRKSVQQKRAGVTENVSGLSYYLTDKVKNISEIIAQTDVDNLSFIFAGPRIPDPAEKFESGKFKELISVLRDEYDYIIVDCPPLGLVLDASIIAKNCDGAVIVIEEGKVRRNQALQVREQLEKSNVNILGTVLNKVTPGRYFNDYGYSYGYDE